MNDPAQKKVHTQTSAWVDIDGRLVCVATDLSITAPSIEATRDLLKTFYTKGNLPILYISRQTTTP